MSEAPKPIRNLEMTDADFENIELFSGVQQDAEQYRDQNSDDDRAPTAYIDEGNYWVRLYPEMIINEAGARQLVVVRRFWSYQRAFGVRRLPAPKDGDCPIRQQVQRLKDANYDEAWKYTAKEEGLIKLYIYKMSLKDHKYIKVKTPMFFILRRKQLTALADFLADLSPEDLRNIMNPRVAAPLIKFSFTKGSGGSSSFGFDLAREELPPLPEDFPSLYDVVMPESDAKPPTDEEIAKYKKGISALLAAGTNLLNPDEQEGGENPMARAKAAAAGSAKELVNNVKSAAAQAAAASGLAGGAKPAEEAAQTETQVNASDPSDAARRAVQAALGE